MYIILRRHVTGEPKSFQYSHMTHQFLIHSPRQGCSTLCLSGLLNTLPKHELLIRVSLLVSGKKEKRFEVIIEPLEQTLRPSVVATLVMR